MRWTGNLILQISYSLLLVAIANAREISKSSHEFDFFLFVLQWPGGRSFYRYPCCYPPDGKPMTDFLIHGLWPQKNDGTFPQHCTPEEFNSSKVEAIRADLNRLWPSLDCPGDITGNPRFWRHEWEKHGTCSAMTQIEYFKATIEAWNLLHEADFLTALHDYGIDPSDSGVMYSKSLMTQILNNVLWSKFPLRYENASLGEIKRSASPGNLRDDELAVWAKCGYNSVDETTFQLLELWICLDRQKRPMTCPRPIGLLCGDDIPFHTFQDCSGNDLRIHSQPSLGLQLQS